MTVLAAVPAAATVGHPAIDPLVEQELLGTPLVIIVLKVLVVFVLGLVGTMLMVWFERKVVSGMQNRVGPEQGRTVRVAADAGRRHEAVLQRGHPSQSRRPVRVPTGAVPGVRPCVPRLVGDPTRRRLLRRQHRAGHLVRARDARPARRPADRGPVRAGDVVDRRVRHHARRLGERIEVPPARVRAGLGADDLLRSCARLEPGGGARRCRHAVDRRHRQRAVVVRQLESRRHRLRPVLHLRRRGDRRAEPAAVRPRRSRTGAGVGVQHRVLQHPLRARSSSPSS